MKKISYVIMIILLLFVSGCTKKEKIETTTPEVIEENIYTDDNPIILNFYLRENNGYNMIDKELHTPWVIYQDMPYLRVIPTNIKRIDSYYMQDVFPMYWNKYENHEKYKLGYNLKYNIGDKEYSYNIINPEDRKQQVFNYMQIYTYDDVTVGKGVWHDHLDNNEITEGVLMTTIKLCVSTLYKEITGPLKLTVFSYDDMDDFDPDTKEYRGNSKTTILIYNN